MPASPQLDADGVLTVRITAGGTDLPELVQLISLSVHRAANTIPWARLEFADGDMATQKFDVADDTLLVPGTEIGIYLGYASKSKLVYKGLVMRFGMRITGHNDSRLVIECRDKATQMAVDRRNAVYTKVTDSDLMTKLATKHGLV